MPNSQNYQAYIDPLNTDDSPASQISLLNVMESYNTGWTINVALATPRAAGLDLSTALFTGIRAGLSPGAPASILLAVPGAEPRRPTAVTTEPEDDTKDGEGTPEPTEPTAGEVIRSWPSVIMQSEPGPPPDNTSGVMLHLSLADPITFLSDRPVWGAYRGVSAAEMIGGAISLAAGGDGQPTLSPVLPDMPRVRIIDQLRGDASILPYSIACGQSLGEWLDWMESTLGIRMEMTANIGNDTLNILLTDQLPRGEHLQMAFTDSLDDEALEDASDGLLSLAAIEGRHTIGARGIILDDPIRGTFRRFGAPGSVGSVISATELTLDEAVRRSRFEISSDLTEILIMKVSSRQPVLRPGSLINIINNQLGAIDVWQVLALSHTVNGATYQNFVSIARGDNPWYPSPPFIENTRYATALIDGGDEFSSFDLVPRDRLGRVPIMLSFTPLPLSEDLRLLDVADTDRDMRLTLADFKSDAIDQYESDTEAWEAKVTAYNNREHNDPHPGREDDDLSEDELAERKTAKENREGALKYLAYKKAKALDQADKDRDGYRSRRDSEVSPELEALLRETGSHERIREQLEALKAGETTDDANPISEDLLREYDGLFNDPEPDSDEPDPNAGLRQDAALAKERWPPRIPLTAIEPMAGGLHGFIPGHRHGDICRIAIHNPLFAEIVGYQYRADRQINPHIVGAATGMVAEHDFARAWSGLVFRRIEDIEAAIVTEEGPEGGPEEESPPPS